MKAFVVLDEGYINQAVVSLSSFFKYNRIELVIYAEKNTALTRLTAILPKIPHFQKNGKKEYASSMTITVTDRL